MTYRIGIDIGATNTRILLTTQTGKILRREKIPTQSFDKVEPIISRASAVIDKMLARQRIKKKLIEWTGCGLAGQLDPETGWIDNAPNLRWFGVQFGKKFEKRLGMKIRLVNDVNAAAWGEHLYGKGKRHNNLVAVYVGSGIGGGIVCNGRLFEGAAGTAGEIGHVIFRENGLRCGCGRKGCHEAYAGGVPMENRMRKLVKAGKSLLISKMVKGDLAKINSRTIVAAAKRGDPAAKMVWQDAVSSLNVLCANLVSVFNPEVLVLGGGVIEGNPTLVPTIRAFIKAHAVHRSAQAVNIVKTSLGQDAVALGAAAIIEACN